MTELLHDGQATGTKLTATLHVGVLHQDSHSDHPGLPARILMNWIVVSRRIPIPEQVSEQSKCFLISSKHHEL